MEVYRWHVGDPCPECGPNCVHCSGRLDITERGEGAEGTYACDCCSTVIIPVDSAMADEASAWVKLTVIPARAERDAEREAAPDILDAHHAARTPG
jgi:hypothetical protein